MLCGALGSVVWGGLVDRVGARAPQHKLHCWRCCASLRWCAGLRGLQASASGSLADAQLALIALGGFLMTCTVGPVSAIVIDVIHPGVRATGASVLALFQNLFGLAAGPFIAGVLSDVWGLTTPLVAMPRFGHRRARLQARRAQPTEADMQRASEPRRPRPPRPRRRARLNRPYST